MLMSIVKSTKSHHLISLYFKFIKYEFKVSVIESRILEIKIKYNNKYNLSRYFYIVEYKFIFY